jgi:regulator of protease activity HflC (stomatin/prohibitin superfamily)
MLEPLIDLLKSVGTSILPWSIVDQWQQAVVLRCGRFHRVIGPGFHWRIPFAERSVEYSVVTTTTNLPAQTVVTGDGRTVTAEAVVRWSVDDVRVFATEIWDGANVIGDSCQGAIANALRSLAFDAPELRRAVLDESRRALKRFGIKVEAVTFTTLAPVRVLRLIGGPAFDPAPSA